MPGMLYLVPTPIGNLGDISQRCRDTMPGMLYLVPTPIGNLGDISQRCRDTLAQADFIAAEDTRVTLKLLNHLGLKKSLVSYYEHNKAFKGDVILDRILAGETCALVSDAGSPAISDPGEDLVKQCAQAGITVCAIPGPCAAITALSISGQSLVSDAGSPAISDPGEDLVKQCAQAGITVCAIPGPCAAITALSISGQSTGRVCFEGFLSTAKKSRREHLDSLRQEHRTMIFYEAPHKLLATLEDMAQVFGPDRPISLCRELTKLHEQVLRLTLAQAIELYTQTPPKGEFVLVVAGAPVLEKPAISQEDAAQHLSQLLSQGLSRKDAVKQTAAALNLPKNVVYDLALKLEE